MQVPDNHRITGIGIQFPVVDESLKLSTSYTTSTGIAEVSNDTLHSIRKQILEHKIAKSVEVPTKHDTGKPRPTELPFVGLQHLAELATAGADVYGSGNWRGLEVQRMLNAALRHLIAHCAGEVLSDDVLTGKQFTHLECATLWLLRIIDKENTK